MTYNDMIDTMQDAFRAFYALKNACVTLSVAAQEARKGADAKVSAKRMTPGDAERVEAVQKRFYGILNALVEARPFLVAAEDALVWHRYPLEEALGRETHAEQMARVDAQNARMRQVLAEAEAQLARVANP